MYTCLLIGCRFTSSSPIDYNFLSLPFWSSLLEGQIGWHVIPLPYNCQYCIKLNVKTYNCQHTACLFLVVFLSIKCFKKIKIFAPTALLSWWQLHKASDILLSICFSLFCHTSFALILRHHILTISNRKTGDMIQYPF